MEWWILFCFIALILTLVVMSKRNRKVIMNCQKCVFISGCDSGIGYKLATHLDTLGCTVYAGCLIPDGEGAKLLKEESSARLKIIPLDVTKEKSIYDAVNSVKEDLNGKDLWALVNNAGVCVCGEFDWLTTDQCRHQLEVNLYGTISLTKAFLSFIRRSKGRIVNISSVSGHCTYPGVSVYCATKFALEGLSDCLRLELIKFGVRVIVIRPGDFSRSTRLMANHQKHAKEMWDFMSEEMKSFYGGYFQKYHDKVLQYYEASEPQSSDFMLLLRNVESALFSVTPSSRYAVAPISFKIFFLLLRVLPTNYADKLILFVMKIGFGSDFDY